MEEVASPPPTFALVRGFLLGPRRHCARCTASAVFFLEGHRGQDRFLPLFPQRSWSRGEELCSVFFPRYHLLNIVLPKMGFYFPNDVTGSTKVPELWGGKGRASRTGWSGIEPRSVLFFSRLNGSIVSCKKAQNLIGRVR